MTNKNNFKNGKWTIEGIATNGKPVFKYTKRTQKHFGGAYKNAVFTSLLFAIASLVWLLIVIFTSCCDDGDNCVPDEIRCNKTVLEICDADGYWTRIVDCAANNPEEGYVCCNMGGEPDCALPKECDR